MQEFKDKVVLISGGLGDIGMAVAKAYLQAGALVSLSDLITEAQAALKLDRLSDWEGRYNYYEVNVSDAEAIERWVAGVLALFGHIDICIVNAARVTLKNFRNISNDEWKQEQDVNLNGSFYLANTAARYFVEQQMPGNILFMGSWAAHAVHKGLPAYSVSKAAVRMLCQSMALEYAPFGIQVNELAPGYVNAGLSKVVWSESPELQEEAKNIVPLKKILEVNDIAEQVLWITSTANRHMTGATILLDGGLSLIRP